MAIETNKSPQQQREEELHDREYYQEQMERKFAHDERMKKMELRLSNNKDKIKSRHQATRDTITAVFKMPVWLVVVPAIALLALAKRDVPESLERFLK